MHRLINVDTYEIYQGFHTKFVKDDIAIIRRNLSLLDLCSNGISTPRCATPSYGMLWRPRQAPRCSRVQSLARNRNGFKRGWTLQELIAPRKMKFFDVNWRFLGTRTDVAKFIESSTGVNADFLTRQRDFREASIATRMSWVSDRETPVPEDLVYSLLGIFGVIMPPHYTEGLENAFSCAYSWASSPHPSSSTNPFSHEHGPKTSLASPNPPPGGDGKTTNAVFLLRTLSASKTPGVLPLT
ncbi:hypothetical protein B0O99DRAFT_589406 [Bisporella sp. PMI_857]|nr:hypothetical protein B0O99DRAFT_589406 [Bisporella sp. PMI_857]